MYAYDAFDHDMVHQRVEEFRGQVARRLSGELTEEQFRPLRLMNGVYLQLHAYMLRVAIPYGLLSARQMRTLAQIARKYDKGYGHFTTRQNIQYNWPKLDEIPDLLHELAEVEMHAIQTSGNCIRNTTSDQFAGAVPGEADDPRVWSEIIRQWSTFHPEFTYLPRKFKIAVTGTTEDRAAIRVHDIGIEIRTDDEGRVGFGIFVGGGQGRTPMIAKEIHPFVQQADLLAYIEAILRVYNLYGRRDNKYKARIKILVHEEGIDKIRDEVDAEFQAIKDGVLGLDEADIQRIRDHFAPPPYVHLDDASQALAADRASDKAFDRFVATNVTEHRQAGYAIVSISLKPIGGIPGDASADQMDLLADLADRYSFGEIVVTHEQNLVLAHVRQDNLKALWLALKGAGLDTPNVGLLSDIIACPGMDYCSLATARSIPIAQEIAERFNDLDRQFDVGGLKLNISGCINACGHHHVAHLGILGLEKKGVESYQITLGGDAGEQAAVGKILGPGFGAEEIVDAVETVIDTYLKIRTSREEPFIETVRRLGLEPFKEALYAAA
ncbi:MAG: nitrite/sulfite reductase [Magnetovibrionaceae bacterium]